MRSRRMISFGSLYRAMWPLACSISSASLMAPAPSVSCLGPRPSAFAPDEARLIGDGCGDGLVDGGHVELGRHGRESAVPL